MEARAILRNCPSSPRKMRLVADLVRGKKVSEALNILKFANKDATRNIDKLLVSAVSNFQQKHESVDIEDLFVTMIKVDSGAFLKRIRPAPQGRAHRVKKRSNHVTIVVGKKAKPE